MTILSATGPSQWAPYVVITLMLCLLWVGVIILWIGGKSSKQAKQNMERNIGRFFSAEWVGKRIYLIIIPIAIISTVTFLTILIALLLFSEQGSMPAFIGMLLVALFVVAPILIVILCVSLVRNGKPRFLVPPMNVHSRRVWS